ncbi:FAD:protein FMN transferase [Boseongicola sp. H5]|uniref:FAD:protein FMN transferase n=1 Tax=Boseongicola sp. H5 TaxID=2763261 RepID=UPI001D09E436|nr:FAD:protein FMN transferase [Boseongicola sp. H5]
MNRRGFLSITAATAGAALLPPRRGSTLTSWRGVALGAAASIHLDHPQADRLVALARAEIERLENIFSLYRPGSEISRLNADGTLLAPSFELLECLSLAGWVHRTTDGMFDPTIQPLWTLYADHAARGFGGMPPTADRRSTLSVIGWGRVRFEPAAVALPEGGGLSLNGIAQGYIADRVADLLRAEGLTDILIDTGEICAVGNDPRGGAWRVGLHAGDRDFDRMIDLSDAAVASSAPLGTVFDRAGTVGHILDPRTGLPVIPHRRFVSVAAPRAAMADALSTAFCGMDDDAIERCLSAHSEARVAYSLRS